MASPEFLAAARGDIPADLVLRNGRLVNVFSGEIEPVDIAVHGDRIAGVGSGYAGRQEVDLAGAYVAPGLIDAHVHIESSMCLPAQFAAAVVPRGVTTAVTDPHEIANVAGVAGVRFMVEASKDLPLRIVTLAPSCVPATDMATTGGRLGADDLAGLLREGIVHGLAEVMNYPGVIAGDPEVAAKLGGFRGQVIDGHAPGVRGKALSAYAAAGVGSDHECVTVEEAKEKLARGLYVLIREATTARNLDALLPLVTPANSRRICFCTDDRTPVELLEQGSIDEMLRRAIAFGIDPVTAFRMATLNAVEWFQLHDRGAIAPGRLADLFVFDDLKAPAARLVYRGGRIVARGGNLTAPLPALAIPPALTESCHFEPLRVDLRVPAKGDRIRVIGAIPDQLITEQRIIAAKITSGLAVADPDRDLLKIAVVERHRNTGRIGLGFIQGFGIKYGAIAGTFGHDHHNVIAIGDWDLAMLSAMFSLREMGGGFVAVKGLDTVLAALPLRVGGLMSDAPIGDVADGYRKLLAAARELGSALRDPFMAMSFMALEVIPSLKLTDRGLVDVDAFRHVDLFV